jgi:dinuclear metal center YbgI/SA1388 family protein
MKIAEFMQHVQQFAPLATALDWDNSGLQLGNLEWETQRAMLCLDVNQAALEAALEAGAGLIVAHHPLIFRPLKQISDPLLLALAQHKIAVLSLHTNLDVAPMGVNHALAAKLGLQVLDILSHSTGETWYRVGLGVPPDHLETLKEAVFAAGGGSIGNYGDCATFWPVEGIFRPRDDAHPSTLGEVDAGGQSHVREVQMEFMCAGARLSGVLAAIRAAHPYETPALYYFAVSSGDPAYGLGLVCETASPVTLDELGSLCKQALSCPAPRLWSAGKPRDARFSRIAICGGSGGSLLRDAARTAEVFISGDISYHSFLESSIPVIDAGHFYTEYPVLDILAGILEGYGLACDVLPMARHDFPARMH